MSALLSLLALPAVVLSGCSLGKGTGALSGSLYVEECTTESDYGAAGAPAPYNLNPTFFVADPINDFQSEHPDNKVTIRVQSSGQPIELADALIVGIADVGPVALALGQPLPLGPATNVRAGLSLSGSCPAQPVEAEGDGTITFTSFGSAAVGAAVPADFKLGFGDRLAAEVHIDLIDRRAISLGGSGSVPTAPVLSGHLDGNFDFVIRAGRIAQTFN
jgi:hypothetical protein